MAVSSKDIVPGEPRSAIDVYGAERVKVVNTSELLGDQNPTTRFVVGNKGQSVMENRRDCYVDVSVPLFEPGKKESVVTMEKWAWEALSYFYGKSGHRNPNKLAEWDKEIEAELTERFALKRKGTLDPPEPHEVLGRGAGGKERQERIAYLETMRKWSVPQLDRFVSNNSLQVPKDLATDSKGELDVERYATLVISIAKSVLNGGGELNLGQPKK